MTRVDPRAQLAWLAAAVLAALFGDVAGAVAVAVGAAGLALGRGETARARRAAVAVLPIAVGVLLIDVGAGQAAAGALAALRLGALALAGAAFSAVADTDRLLAALRWLRVPFDVSFLLVVGPRFIPLATADLADLADAARLRGLAIDGGISDRLRSWSRLLVPLLVVTIRRGLRLGEAMEARAFSPERPRSARGGLRWRPADTVAAAGAALFLVVVLILAR